MDVRDKGVNHIWLNYNRLGHHNFTTPVYGEVFTTQLPYHSSISGFCDGYATNV